MYPPADPNKVQKAFLACTPFNILLAHYYVIVKQDYKLMNYLNDVAADMLKETTITPQTIIDQIESEYEKYLINNGIEIPNGDN